MGVSRTYAQESTLNLRKAGVCAMGKYFFTALLGLMSLTAAIVGIVYRSNPYFAITLGCLCVAFFGVALVAAAYESLPKPKLIPVGYGTVGEPYSKLLAAGYGLLFENHGDPACSVTPPKPTKFGNSTLVFDDPGIAWLTKEQGVRCFPVTIKDTFGERTVEPSYLRMQLVLGEATLGSPDSVLISFQYADSKKPQSLRYTTICKIEPHGTGLKVSLIDCKFDWRRLFWDRG